MPTPNPYTASDGTVTWRVRVRAHGRNTSETFGTERAALSFCKEVSAIGAEDAIARRNRVDKAHDDSVPTLRQWIPRHIELLTGVHERTRIDYQTLAERTFLRYLGDHHLDDIDREQVAQCINSLERQAVTHRQGKPTGRTLSGKTIANAHGLLSAAMASAVMHDLIPTNPCHKMRLPRAGGRTRKLERFLTHEEFDRLYAAFPEKYQPFLLTMFGTGLRWSEITALQLCDYAPAIPASAAMPSGMPATLQVLRAWKRIPGVGMRLGEPKSPKSQRRVMLPKQVDDAIRPLLNRDREAWLFAAMRGGPVQYGRFYSEVWKPACISAGLTVPRTPSPHDARHTHASWLLEQPLVTLEMVQDQLGHESILTTRRVYGHLQPAMRNAYAEAATRAMAVGEAMRQIESAPD